MTQEIGKGAYGKIFLGRPKDKPNIVRAIKMIKKDITNAHHMNEAIILRQLDHPNVLKLYAIFEDNKAYYLVTEYWSHNQATWKVETCLTRPKRFQWVSSKQEMFLSKS